MEEKEVTLPERLVELRTKRGKTQQQVADYLEMTRTGYSYYEKGRTKPDYPTIQKLAEFYKVTPNYIIGEDEETPHHDAGALAILTAIDLSDEDAVKLLKENLTYEGKEIDEANLREILDYARYRLAKPQADREGR